MATKQEFLDSIKRLEDRVASRKESSAVAQAKITKLISEGKNREAYRVFEELPIMEQIALSITPGFGDALAAFETGEFKTRADERFAQDDTLGGIGNLALSGLAGASLLPIIGPVAGAAGKVGKSLGRVAKVDSDMPTGGPSTFLPEVRPNEYVGTRLEGTKKGLSSPNLRTLREMKSDKKQSLIKLVTRLVKANPDKVGELRMLNVIEDVKPGKFSGDKIVLTPEVRSFFSAFTDGKDIATPAGLDLYMTNKMPDSIKVRTLGPNESQIGKDYGLDTVDGAKRRLYGVKGVDGSKNSFDHTSSYYSAGPPDYKNPDNTIAFDSVVKDPNDPKVIRVNRIQSDYAEELGKVQKERRKIAENYSNSPFSNNPFEKPTVNIGDDVQEQLKNLKEIGQETNKDIAEINKDETFNLLFEDYKLDETGNIIKTDGSTLPKTRLKPEEIAKIGNNPNSSKLVEVLDGLRKRDQITDKIKALLKRDNEILFNEGFFQGVVNPKFSADYTDLAPGQSRIAQRNLAYDSDVFRQTEDETFALDPQYYGNTELPIDRFGIQKKMDIDSIDDAIRNVNLEDSKLVYKKDPYAKKNTSQTHKLPIRSIINETAQNTDREFLEVPLDRLFRSNEIGGDNDAAKLGVRDFYEDTYGEMQKIAKELDLPFGSVYKVEGDVQAFEIFNKKTNKYDVVEVDLDNMRINLDAVRDALNKGKTIDAFKKGGPVSIQSLLNNL